MLVILKCSSQLGRSIVLEVTTCTRWLAAVRGSDVVQHRRISGL